jgi:hypothetical protein
LYRRTRETFDYKVEAHLEDSRISMRFLQLRKINIHLLARWKLSKRINQVFTLSVLKYNESICRYEVEANLVGSRKLVDL